MVAVNKADGANVAAAQRAAAAFSSTLRLHRRMRRSWAPIVLPVSAHSGEGIEKLRALLEEYRITLESRGELQEVRSRMLACPPLARRPGTHLAAQRMRTAGSASIGCLSKLHAPMLLPHSCGVHNGSGWRGRPPKKACWKACVRSDRT